MLGRQLLMQADAVGLEIGHGLQRCIEVAVHLLAERRRLLDGCVLGEHQHFRARRRAVRNPTRDLVPPSVERGGLIDRVLRGGDLEGLAVAHGAYVVTLSGFIQNCMAWSVSTSWSMSFQA